MARKTQEAKALFDVKGDFYESLDAFCQAGLNFHFAVKTALDLGQIAEPARDIIQARMTVFLRAMSPSECGEDV